MKKTLGGREQPPAKILGASYYTRIGGMLLVATRNRGEIAA